MILSVLLQSPFHTVRIVKAERREYAGTESKRGVNLDSAIDFWWTEISVAMYTDFQIYSASHRSSTGDFSMGRRPPHFVLSVRGVIIPEPAVVR